jgi:asparagine synthase (glutamine-hydrolysing)
MLDERQAVSGTVEHLRRAVHRQLVADVPVGAFLSGGLDSSAVVTFAREQEPDIRCFTIESVGDRMPGSLTICRMHAGWPDISMCRWIIITVDAGAMANDLEAMVGQLDEPLADPAPLNVLYISQLARRHGMKVLLSGAGATICSPATVVTSRCTTNATGDWLPPPSASAWIAPRTR